MKRGRPINPESKKGRTHSALLTVKAELILRSIKSKRQEFNFSEYVTQSIIKDFGSNTADIAALRTELDSLNNDMLKKENRIQEVMSQIKQLKLEEDDRESQAILANIR